MATTTNYSWTTPDDTDLVKDGAAAIRTLGSSADTTVKNLNPGTTAGDIDYYTSGTAKARIAIGTAGQVLQVNAGATAPEWATPASGGGMTQLATGSFSGSTTTISSISGSYKNLQLVIRNVSGANVTVLRLRLNGDTGTNYVSKGSNVSGDGITFDENNAILASMHSSGDNSIIIDLPDYANTATPKLINCLAIVQANATPTYNLTQIRSAWEDTSAINEINLFYTTGNFDAGTYILYGVE